LLLFVYYIIFCRKFRYFFAGMATAVEESGISLSSSIGAEKRTREQGVRLKYLLMKSAVSAGLLVGVWLVGYYRFSVTWVIVPSLVGVGVVEYRKPRKLAAGERDSEQSLLGRVEELPSWVSMLLDLCHTSI